MASAVILAGGRSMRFGGRDKGALLLEGLSILDRQLAVLGELSDDVMIVGGRDPRATGVRHVPDRAAGCGPLGGLDAALASARDHHVLVLACDMPFVTATLLTYLLAQAASADAVVPKTERGYHPLCAVYARGCREAVERRLAARKLAMLGLLDDVRTRTVTEAEIRQFGEPDRLLANVNTPDDLEALRRHER